MKPSLIMNVRQLTLTLLLDPLPLQEVVLLIADGFNPKMELQEQLHPLLHPTPILNRVSSMTMVHNQDHFHLFNQTLTSMMSILLILHSILSISRFMYRLQLESNSNNSNTNLRCFLIGLNIDMYRLSHSRLYTNHSSSSSR